MIKIPEKWIKWIKRVLLVAGIGLIAVGLIMTLFYNVIIAPCSIENSFIKTAPEFSVFDQELDIDTMLFQPKAEYNFYGNDRPAVVLVHGFISSKVYFRGLAYELTKRGFVCLTLSANGHSASGGGFTPTWENVTLSAVKYLRENSALLGIDINRIGLVGHSMGSFSVTIASVLDQELENYWINATVGIGGPFLNISKGFGQGFAYFLANPMVYPDVWYDPAEAMQNAIIEGRSNLTRPYNYMNIIGATDEAFSQESAYELIYGMSTPAFWSAYGVADQSQIVTSHTYGTFNGTARRLVVIPGLGHALEGQHEITVNETINWLEDSMKLKAESSYPGILDISTIKIDGTSISGMLAGLGGLIIIIPLIAYLGNWLKPEIVIPKNAMSMKKNDKRKMFLFYGIAFVGISFLAPLIISGLNLNISMATDFLASNLIALPIFVQGLLTIPLIIFFMWYENRKYGLTRSDYGLTTHPKSYLKSATYGFLLFLVLYITLNIASSWTIHNLYIWRFVGFLELFTQIFIGILIFEIFFRGFIQNKLYELQSETGLFPTRVKEILKAAIITGIIEGLALGIIVTGVLAAGGFDVFSSNMAGMIPEGMGMSFSWLPPMFILLPAVFVGIEVGLGVIKAGLYREINRNVMASALFIALILAWLLSVLLPATNLYAPRFVFMT